MAETNNVTSNTTASDENKIGVSKKRLKNTKVNDAIAKGGKAMTGSPIDKIEMHPVQEAAEHTAVTNLNMRAQPVHKGHAKVIKAVEDEAKRVGGSAHIVTSHSEGDEKNPIPTSKKVGYLKKVAAPSTHVNATSREAFSPLHTAARLNRSAHHLVVVAGSDRADEYHKLLHKYNGKEGPHGYYNFKSITVKKIDRDPDAEGTKGVSGTKMREHAKNGDISKFKSGLPAELHQHAEEMMSDINKASKKKVKEDLDDLFSAAMMIDTDNTHEVLDIIEEAFGKNREAVPRSGQDRKKIDLTTRQGEDRKKDDRPFRLQSIIKRRVDEAMRKTPADKIRDAMKARGVDIDSTKHRNEMEKNKADYQAILDKEKKQKTNEAFDNIDEVSNELAGRVNKARFMQNKPSKTKSAEDTLSRRVDKARGVTRTKEYKLPEVKPGLEYFKSVKTEAKKMYKCPECGAPVEKKGMNCGACHENMKEEAVHEEKKGLWANIWARRRAGKRMRKPGEKGAPTAAALKAARESVEIDEAANAGLAAKAKKSGVSLSTLQKVYRRGVAAWNSGHRPGTTPQQWAMARVNSYIAKGKGTYGGADKDLHEDHEEIKENYAADNKAYHAGLSKSTAKARVAHWKKMSKYSDRDPRAYEPAPGDATAKTKPSKYTIAYHKKYGD